MLHLHTSNQLEQLAIQYARITNEPLKNVFEPELLVVQNAGMARYLSMHVADLSGISANTEALFPAEFKVFCAGFSAAAHVDVVVNIPQTILHH